MSGFPVTGYKLMVISRGRSFPDGVSSFITPYSSGTVLISQVIFSVCRFKEPGTLTHTCTHIDATRPTTSVLGAV